MSTINSVAYDAALGEKSKFNAANRLEDDSELHEIHLTSQWTSELATECKIDKRISGLNVRFWIS